MKKALLAIMALLLCAQSGYAQENTIIGSKARVFGENVYLLIEPANESETIELLPRGTEVLVLNEYDENYLYVEYNTIRGYVDSTQVEISIGLSLITVMPILTDAEKSNISRFITDFTKTDFTYYCNGNFKLDEAADGLLVEYALDSLWFEHNELWELGEYDEECNYRISDEYTASIVKRYFGRNLESLESMRFHYKDGFYYLQETGGKTGNGFAVITEVKDQQNGGDYIVYFNIYGAGCIYGDEVYSMNIQEAAEAFPDYFLQGKAVIHAADFNDMESMTLSEYLVAY